MNEIFPFNLVSFFGSKIATLIGRKTHLLKIKDNQAKFLLHSPTEPNHMWSLLFSSKKTKKFQLILQNIPYFWQYHNIELNYLKIRH